MSVENDVVVFDPSNNEYKSDEDGNISLEIRSFLNVSQSDKSVDQLLMPHLVDKLISDADDVCNIAIIIVRKLYGDDYSDFSLQILQIISDIRDPLEEKAPLA